MRVAGVKIGTIAGVQLDEGVAVVDVEIEPKYKGMIREDATALLRPRTALKDMFVEVAPGDGSRSTTVAASRSRTLPPTSTRTRSSMPSTRTLAITSSS